jgi:tetratricopeptide (TPR) repeat protein
LLHRGDYAGAVDGFEISLKKRKDWVEALLNLALATWKFGDLDAAEATYQRVLALKPSHIDALRALAALALERKDVKRALELHQALASAGGRSVEVSFNTGMLLQAAGELEKAADCFRAAVDQKPDFSQALLGLGNALKALGKEEEARGAWSRAVESDPALAGKYFQ